MIKIMLYNFSFFPDIGRATFSPANQRDPLFCVPNRCKVGLR